MGMMRGKFPLEEFFFFFFLIIIFSVGVKFIFVVYCACNIVENIIRTIGLIFC